MTGASGPAVVAIGGGHGLASALRAARRYATDVTAVVSVADDGGSSGRLVADLEILPPGDMRKCLVALAKEDNVWSEALEHRFESGDLKGHALGNVILAGLAEVCGGFPAALSEMEGLLRCEGRVLPATTERVRLVAETDTGQITGQVAIANAGTPILEVSLDPAEPKAHPAVLEAIADADQIILGPGSLFTSVLPPLVVPEIRQAVAEAAGTRIYVCNLVAQPGETDGLSAADHVAALQRHGIEFDVVIYEQYAGGPVSGGVDPAELVAGEFELVAAALASADNPAHHDTGLLAVELTGWAQRR